MMTAKGSLGKEVASLTERTPSTPEREKPGEAPEEGLRPNRRRRAN